MAVTRCVCFKTSFAELLPKARAAGITDVDDIRSHFGCGSGCGGCRPYLEAMLETGATCFAVRNDRDEKPVPSEPEPWDVA